MSYGTLVGSLNSVGDSSEAARVSASAIRTWEVSDKQRNHRSAGRHGSARVEIINIIWRLIVIASRGASIATFDFVTVFTARPPRQ